MNFFWKIHFEFWFRTHAISTVPKYVLSQLCLVYKLVLIAEFWIQQIQILTQFKEQAIKLQCWIGKMNKHKWLWAQVEKMKKVWNKENHFLKWKLCFNTNRTSFPQYICRMWGCFRRLICPSNFPSISHA